MQPAKKSLIELAGGLLVCFLVVGEESSFAQSFGDIARRERQRRERQPQRSTRVYTNEDLARPKILGPEERARPEAPRPASTVPPIEGTVELPGAVKWLDEIPLGDIARYYRRVRQLRQKQELVEQAKPASGPSLASPTVPKPLAASTPMPGLKNFQPIKMAEPVKADKLQSGKQVRVQSGDSLWKLASQYLGSGNEWREIAAVNPELSDPNFIRVGQWLRLPPGASSAGTKQVRVKEGDSLWKLAQAQLENGQAWGCIAAVNPQIQDANLIYPGQLLTIPTGCATIS